MNEHPTLDISSPQQARGAYTEFHWTPEDTERFWSFESQFPERYFTYRNGLEMYRIASGWFYPLILLIKIPAFFLKVSLMT